MSLDAAALLGDADREAYADFLALELAKCRMVERERVSLTVQVTGTRWEKSKARRVSQH